MPTITATASIAAPAAEVWAILADYGHDPSWRQGVSTMAPSPPGLVRQGTTTAEVLRLGGRTYRNDGEVTSVEPGRRFTWRTTSGADAEGSRAVRPVDGATSSVTLVVTVRPHGLDRLFQPVLLRMLRKGIEADLGRLAALVERRQQALPAA